MKHFRIIALFLIVFLAGCTSHNQTYKVSAPNTYLSAYTGLDNRGKPYYFVMYNGDTLINKSKMGLSFKDKTLFSSAFKVLKTETRNVQQDYVLPWGTIDTINFTANELLVYLAEESGLKRKLNIRFRVFDDGFGFRYEVPKQSYLSSMILVEENTAFQLLDNGKCWWIPGDWDSYEYLYQSTLLSEIDAQNVETSNLIPHNAVNTPFTLKTNSGVYLSFHEAALVNYPGMTLKVDTQKLSLQSCLVGSERIPGKALIDAPFNSPWRTVQVSESPAGLVESNIILNLNEPNILGDVSWFSPQKYVGVWWEMHMGISTWKKGYRHGANTENVKRYINFAGANQIEGVLVEGWNTGWEHWLKKEDKNEVFDFVTPYDDFNLTTLNTYARSKNTQLILHHETMGDIPGYEKRLDTAFALLNKLGIHVLKTGYVGKIKPEGEYHHGQYMVNHYQKVVEKAAEYNIALNVHECIKPTGLRRTYPNLVTGEGMRGQEYNAWSPDGGNPPEHIPTLVFTRMLAGPADYTPGIFDVSLKHKNYNQVNTTLAHQLALYVVVYSPLQMVSDIPENYHHQSAFEFVKEVGVDWEKSLVLDGEIGEYVVVARKEKDTGNWFVGGVNNQHKRDFTIDFSFLPVETKYQLHLYRDNIESHYKLNPAALDVIIKEVEAADTMKLFMAEGGGFAASIFPIKE